MTQNPQKTSSNKFFEPNVEEEIVLTPRVSVCYLCRQKTEEALESFCLCGKTHQTCLKKLILKKKFNNQSHDDQEERKIMLSIESTYKCDGCQKKLTFRRSAFRIRKLFEVKDYFSKFSSFQIGIIITLALIVFCASLWLFYSALFSIVEGEFDPNELILLIISLGILGLVFGGICILFIDENKKPEDIEIKRKKMVESNEFKI